MKPLRIAALVKQIPRFEEIQLGPDGRLKRDGVELAINPYCLRAVSKGVELAQKTGGSCTVISLGPPAAEDVVRWGVAGGAERGNLISDPAFAGSDTLATARALAAAITKEGPFDLILVGKNSVDADTGQVGPGLASSGLSFCLRSAHAGTGGRRRIPRGVSMTMPGLRSRWRCQRSWQRPSVCAHQPEQNQTNARQWHQRSWPGCVLTDLGAGPWGQAGSPTRVGETKLLEINRARQMLQGSLSAQIAQAVSLYQSPRGTGHNHPEAARVSLRQRRTLLQRWQSSWNLSAWGARVSYSALPHSWRRILAPELSRCRRKPRVAQLRKTFGVGRRPPCGHTGGGGGRRRGAMCADWSSTHHPWSVLAPSTTWGRAVASRVAARLGAGLTGDAIQLEMNDHRLVSWKPAFGGRLVAAIRATSPIQMVVRYAPVCYRA